MAKGRKPKQWLSDVVIEEFRTASPDTLKQFILDSLGKIAEVKKQKKADIQLAQLQSDVKDITKGYSNATKYEESKIEFARELLSDKGAA